MLRGRIILDNGLEAAFVLGNATEAALEQEAAEVRRVTGCMGYTVADELMAQLKSAVHKSSLPDSRRTGPDKKYHNPIMGENGGKVNGKSNSRTG